MDCLKAFAPLSNTKTITILCKFNYNKKHRGEKLIANYVQNQRKEFTKLPEDHQLISNTPL